MKAQTSIEEARARVEKSHKLADGLMAHLVSQSERSPEHRPISCGYGCAACCFDKPVVHRDEVRVMLANLTDKQRAAVIQKAAEWTARSAELGHLAYQGEPIDNPTISMPMNEYKALGIACPFLHRFGAGDRGFCIAYKDRPAICRMHNAVTPPQNCRHDSSEPVLSIMSNRDAEAHALVYAPLLKSVTDETHSTHGLGLLGELLGDVIAEEYKSESGEHHENNAPDNPA